MNFAPAIKTAKQTTLPTCWSPGAEASPSSDSSSVNSDEDKPRGKPLMWTRVKSLAQIKSQKVMVYDAGEDLKFDRTLKVIRKELEHDRGEFVFDPADFKEAAASFDEESYRLPRDGLLEYAVLATRLRRHFTQKADAAREETLAPC